MHQKVNHSEELAELQNRYNNAVADYLVAEAIIQEVGPQLTRAEILAANEGEDIT